MAQFGDSQEDLAVLERLLGSPPSKFLELGTDQLLTDHFRGGGLGIESTLSVVMETTHSERYHRGVEPKGGPKHSTV